jgi:hypothetical protein
VFWIRAEISSAVQGWNRYSGFISSRGRRPNEELCKVYCINHCGHAALLFTCLLLAATATSVSGNDDVVCGNRDMLGLVRTNDLSESRATETRTF